MRTFVFLVLLAAVGPSTVVAQTAGASDAATARALFVEGVALARRGDYADACDRFRRSQALRPAPPVALNLASALVHTGALVEASEVLAQLLRDPDTTPALRASGIRLREQIAPRLARLTLRVSGDASDVRVELDQRALPDAAIGVPVQVDPGEHELRALRDDEEVAHDRVTLADGESRELTLTILAREIPTPEVPRAALEPVIAARVVAPPEPAAAVRGNDDGVWIAVGIGVALLAAGAIATTAVVLTMPQGPMPVPGNTMPGVLRW